MAIRELINEHSRVVIGVVVTVVLCLLVGITMQMKSAPAATMLKQAYFSDDDGQSFFIDQASQVAPFDHNGKEAVAAHVYSIPHGKPFVGYLERATSPEARTVI